MSADKQIINVPMLEYSTDFQQVTNNKLIYTDCNTVSFINYGTTTATIENVAVLQPGQQLVIGGNTNEYTRQTFQVSFGTSTVGNNVVIIRKRYINLI